MHYNVLLIDDETTLAGMTAKYLNIMDITTLTASGSEEGLQLLKENEFDLILLDINLSGESGFDLCQRIRTNYDMPIFFISARDSIDDMLAGLYIGGDDYITKPFDLSILAAKLKARLKRRVKQQEEKPVCQKNRTLQIDFMKMKAYRKGKELELKAKEFKLLAYFMTHMNQVISKEEILYEVWGDTFISDNALSVQISRLREKIEENPNEPEYIKTIWGKGYLFEADDEI